MDSFQQASAEQFNRQSDLYAKAHILADTSDIVAAMEGVSLPEKCDVLDVAAGCGHLAMFFAQKGMRVTAGDVAERMLENTAKEATRNGLRIKTVLFPSEAMPFDNASYDLVASRVAPHHFSSPVAFIKEASRVLKPGGVFLLIDGSVPDDSPEAGEWLNRVEKLRDPSHRQFLSRSHWEQLVTQQSLRIIKSTLRPKEQPNLAGYFDTAGTSAENRRLVLTEIENTPTDVKEKLHLVQAGERTRWFWSLVSIVAEKVSA